MFGLRISKFTIPDLASATLTATSPSFTCIAAYREQQQQQNQGKELADDGGTALGGKDEGLLTVDLYRSRGLLRPFSRADLTLPPERVAKASKKKKMDRPKGAGEEQKEQGIDVPTDAAALLAKATTSDEWSQYEHIRVDLALSKEQCDRIDLIESIGANGHTAALHYERSLTVVDLFWLSDTLLAAHCRNRSGTHSSLKIVSVCPQEGSRPVKKGGADDTASSSSFFNSSSKVTVDATLTSVFACQSGSLSDVRRGLRDPVHSNDANRIPWCHTECVAVTTVPAPLLEHVLNRAATNTPTPTSYTANTYVQSNLFRARTEARSLEAEFLGDVDGARDMFKGVDDLAIADTLSIGQRIQSSIWTVRPDSSSVGALWVQMDNMVACVAVSDLIAARVLEADESLGPPASSWRRAYRNPVSEADGLPALTLAVQYRVPINTNNIAQYLSDWDTKTRDVYTSLIAGYGQSFTGAMAAEKSLAFRKRLEEELLVPFKLLPVPLWAAVNRYVCVFDDEYGELKVWALQASNAVICVANLPMRLPLSCLPSSSSGSAASGNRFGAASSLTAVPPLLSTYTQILSSTMTSPSSDDKEAPIYDEYTSPPASFVPTSKLDPLRELRLSCPILPMHTLSFSDDSSTVFILFYRESADHVVTNANRFLAAVANTSIALQNEGTLSEKAAVLRRRAASIVDSANAESSRLESLLKLEGSKRVDVFLQLLDLEKVLRSQSAAALAERGAVNPPRGSSASAVTGMPIVGVGSGMGTAAAALAVSAVDFARVFCGDELRVESTISVPWGAIERASQEKVHLYTKKFIVPIDEVPNAADLLAGTNQEILGQGMSLTEGGSADVTVTGPSTPYGISAHHQHQQQPTQSGYETEGPIHNTESTDHHQQQQTAATKIGVPSAWGSFQPQQDSPLLVGVGHIAIVDNAITLLTSTGVVFTVAHTGETTMHAVAHWRPECLATGGDTASEAHGGDRAQCTESRSPPTSPHRSSDIGAQTAGSAVFSLVSTCVLLRCPRPPLPSFAPSLLLREDGCYVYFSTASASTKGAINKDCLLRNEINHGGATTAVTLCQLNGWSAAEIQETTLHLAVSESAEAVYHVVSLAFKEDCRRRKKRIVSAPAFSPAVGEGGASPASPIRAFSQATFESIAGSPLRSSAARSVHQMQQRKSATNSTTLPLPSAESIEASEQAKVAAGSSGTGGGSAMIRVEELLENLVYTPDTERPVDTLHLLTRLCNMVCVRFDNCPDEPAARRTLKNLISTTVSMLAVVGRYCAEFSDETVLAYRAYTNERHRLLDSLEDSYLSKLVREAAPLMPPFAPSDEAYRRRFFNNEIVSDFDGSAFTLSDDRRALFSQLVYNPLIASEDTYMLLALRQGMLEMRAAIRDQQPIYGITADSINWSSRPKGMIALSDGVVVATGGDNSALAMSIHASASSYAPPSISYSTAAGYGKGVRSLLDAISDQVRSGGGSGRGDANRYPLSSSPRSSYFVWSPPVPSPPSPQPRMGGAIKGKAENASDIVPEALRFDWLRLVDTLMAIISVPPSVTDHSSSTTTDPETATAACALSSPSAVTNGLLFMNLLLPSLSHTLLTVLDFCCFPAVSSGQSLAPGSPLLGGGSGPNFGSKAGATQYAAYDYVEGQPPEYFRRCAGLAAVGEGQEAAAMRNDSRSPFLLRHLQQLVSYITYERLMRLSAAFTLKGEPSEGHKMTADEMAGVSEENEGKRGKERGDEEERVLLLAAGAELRRVMGVVFGKRLAALWWALLERKTIIPRLANFMTHVRSAGKVSKVKNKKKDKRSAQDGRDGVADGVPIEKSPDAALSEATSLLGIFENLALDLECVYTEQALGSLDLTTAAASSPPSSPLTRVAVEGDSPFSSLRRSHLSFVDYSSYAASFLKSTAWMSLVEQKSQEAVKKALASSAIAPHTSGIHAGKKNPLPSAAASAAVEEASKSTLPIEDMAEPSVADKVLATAFSSADVQRSLLSWAMAVQHKQPYLSSQPRYNDLGLYGSLMVRTSNAVALATIEEEERKQQHPQDDGLDDDDVRGNALPQSNAAVAVNGLNNDFPSDTSGEPASPTTASSGAENGIRAANPIPPMDGETVDIIFNILYGGLDSPFTDFTETPPNEPSTNEGSERAGGMTAAGSNALASGLSNAALSQGAVAPLSLGAAGRKLTAALCPLNTSFHATYRYHSGYSPASGSLTVTSSGAAPSGPSSSLSLAPQHQHQHHEHWRSVQHNFLFAADDATTTVQRLSWIESQIDWQRRKRSSGGAGGQVLVASAKNNTHSNNNTNKSVYSPLSSVMGSQSRGLALATAERRESHVGESAINQSTLTTASHTITFALAHGANPQHHHQGGKGNSGRSHQHQNHHGASHHAVQPLEGAFCPAFGTIPLTLPNTAERGKEGLLVIGGTEGAKEGASGEAERNEWAAINKFTSMGVGAGISSAGPFSLVHAVDDLSEGLLEALIQQDQEMDFNVHEIHEIDDESKDGFERDHRQIRSERDAPQVRRPLFAWYMAVMERLFLLYSVESAAPLLVSVGDAQSERKKKTTAAPRSARAFRSLLVPDVAADFMGESTQRRVWPKVADTGLMATAFAEFCVRRVDASKFYSWAIELLTASTRDANKEVLPIPLPSSALQKSNAVRIVVDQLINSLLAFSSSPIPSSSSSSTLPPSSLLPTCDSPAQDENEGTAIDSSSSTTMSIRRHVALTRLDALIELAVSRDVFWTDEWCDTVLPISRKQQQQQQRDGTVNKEARQTRDEVKARTVWSSLCNGPTSGKVVALRASVILRALEAVAYEAEEEEVSAAYCRASIVLDALSPLQLLGIVRGHQDGVEKEMLDRLMGASAQLVIRRWQLSNSSRSCVSHEKKGLESRYVLLLPAVAAALSTLSRSPLDATDEDTWAAFALITTLHQQMLHSADDSNLNSQIPKNKNLSTEEKNTVKESSGNLQQLLSLPLTKRCGINLSTSSDPKLLSLLAGHVCRSLLVRYRDRQTKNSLLNPLDSPPLLNSPKAFVAPLFVATYMLHLVPLGATSVKMLISVGEALLSNSVIADACRRPSHYPTGNMMVSAPSDLLHLASVLRNRVVAALAVFSSKGLGMAAKTNINSNVNNAVSVVACQEVEDDVLGRLRETALGLAFLLRQHSSAAKTNDTSMTVSTSLLNESHADSRSLLIHTCFESWFPTVSSVINNSSRLYTFSVRGGSSRAPMAKELKSSENNGESLSPAVAGWFLGLRGSKLAEIREKAACNGESGARPASPQPSSSKKSSMVRPRAGVGGGVASHTDQELGVDESANEVFEAVGGSAAAVVRAIASWRPSGAIISLNNSPSAVGARESLPVGPHVGDANGTNAESVGVVGVVELLEDLRPYSAFYLTKALIEGCGEEESASASPVAVAAVRAVLDRLTVATRAYALSRAHRPSALAASYAYLSLLQDLPDAGDSLPHPSVRVEFHPEHERLLVDASVVRILRGAMVYCPSALVVLNENANEGEEDSLVDSAKQRITEALESLFLVERKPAREQASSLSAEHIRTLLAALVALHANALRFAAARSADEEAGTSVDALASLVAEGHAMVHCSSFTAKGATDLSASLRESVPKMFAVGEDGVEDGVGGNTSSSINSKKSRCDWDVTQWIALGGASSALGVGADNTVGKESIGTALSDIVVRFAGCYAGVLDDDDGGGCDVVAKDTVRRYFMARWLGRGGGGGDEAITGKSSSWMAALFQAWALNVPPKCLIYSATNEALYEDADEDDSQKITQPWQLPILHCLQRLSSHWSSHDEEMNERVLSEEMKSARVASVSLLPPIYKLQQTDNDDDTTAAQQKEKEQFVRQIINSYTKKKVGSLGEGLIIPSSSYGYDSCSGSTRSHFAGGRFAVAPALTELFFSAVIPLLEERCGFAFAHGLMSVNAVAPSAQVATTLHATDDSDVSVAYLASIIAIVGLAKDQRLGGRALRTLLLRIDPRLAAHLGEKGSHKSDDGDANRREKRHDNHFQQSYTNGSILDALCVVLSSMVKSVAQDDVGMTNASSHSSAAVGPPPSRMTLELLRSVVHLAQAVAKNSAEQALLESKSLGVESHFTLVLQQVSKSAEEGAASSSSWTSLELSARLLLALFEGLAYANACAATTTAGTISMQHASLVWADEREGCTLRPTTYDNDDFPADETTSAQDEAAAIINLALASFAEVLREAAADPLKGSSLPLPWQLVLCCSDIVHRNAFVTEKDKFFGLGKSNSDNSLTISAGKYECVSADAVAVASTILGLSACAITAFAVAGPRATVVPPGPFIIDLEAEVLEPSSSLTWAEHPLEMKLVQHASRNDVKAFSDLMLALLPSHAALKRTIRLSSVGDTSHNGTDAASSSPSQSSAGTIPSSLGGARGGFGQRSTVGGATTASGGGSSNAPTGVKPLTATEMSHRRHAWSLVAQRAFHRQLGRSHDSSSAPSPFSLLSSPLSSNASASRAASPPPSALAATNAVNELTDAEYGLAGRMGGHSVLLPRALEATAALIHALLSPSAPIASNVTAGSFLEDSARSASRGGHHHSSGHPHPSAKSAAAGAHPAFMLPDYAPWRSIAELFAPYVLDSTAIQQHLLELRQTEAESCRQREAAIGDSISLLVESRRGVDSGLEVCGLFQCDAERVAVLEDLVEEIMEEVGKFEGEAQMEVVRLLSHEAFAREILTMTVCAGGEDSHVDESTLLKSNANSHDALDHYYSVGESSSSQQAPSSTRNPRKSAGANYWWWLSPSVVRWCLAKCQSSQRTAGAAKGADSGSESAKHSAVSNYIAFADHLVASLETEVTSAGDDPAAVSPDTQALLARILTLLYLTLHTTDCLRDVHELSTLAKASLTIDSICSTAMPLSPRGSSRRVGGGAARRKPATHAKDKETEFQPQPATSPSSIADESKLRSEEREKPQYPQSIPTPTITDSTSRAIHTDPEHNADEIPINNEMEDGDDTTTMATSNAPTSQQPATSMKKRVVVVKKKKMPAASAEAIEQHPFAPVAAVDDEAEEDNAQLASTLVTTTEAAGSAPAKKKVVKKIVKKVVKKAAGSTAANQADDEIGATIADENEQGVPDLTKANPISTTPTVVSMPPIWQRGGDGAGDTTISTARGGGESPRLAATLSGRDEEQQQQQQHVIGVGYTVPKRKGVNTTREIPASAARDLLEVTSGGGGNGVFGVGVVSVAPVSVRRLYNDGSTTVPVFSRCEEHGQSSSSHVAAFNVLVKHLTIPKQTEPLEEALAPWQFARQLLGADRAWVRSVWDGKVGAAKHHHYPQGGGSNCQNLQATKTPQQTHSTAVRERRLARRSALEAVRRNALQQQQQQATALAQLATTTQMSEEMVGQFMVMMRRDEAGGSAAKSAPALAAIGTAEDDADGSNNFSSLFTTDPEFDDWCSDDCSSDDEAVVDNEGVMVPVSSLSSPSSTGDNPYFQRSGAAQAQKPKTNRNPHPNTSNSGPRDPFATDPKLPFKHMSARSYYRDIKLPSFFANADAGQLWDTSVRMLLEMTKKIRRRRREEAGVAADVTATLSSSASAAKQHSGPSGIETVQQAQLRKKREADAASEWAVVQQLMRSTIAAILTFPNYKLVDVLPEVTRLLDIETNEMLRRCRIRVPNPNRHLDFATSHAHPVGDKLRPLSVELRETMLAETEAKIVRQVPLLKASMMLSKDPEEILGPCNSASAHLACEVGTTPATVDSPPTAVLRQYYFNLCRDALLHSHFVPLLIDCGRNTLARESRRYPNAERNFEGDVESFFFDDSSLFMATGGAPNLSGLGESSGWSSVRRIDALCSFLRQLWSPEFTGGDEGKTTVDEAEKKDSTTTKQKNGENNTTSSPKVAATSFITSEFDDNTDDPPSTTRLGLAIFAKIKSFHKSVQLPERRFYSRVFLEPLALCVTVGAWMLQHTHDTLLAGLVASEFRAVANFSMLDGDFELLRKMMFSLGDVSVLKFVCDVVPPVHFAALLNSSPDFQRQPLHTSTMRLAIMSYFERMTSPHIIRGPDDGSAEAAAQMEITTLYANFYHFTALGETLHMEANELLAKFVDTAGGILGADGLAVPQLTKKASWLGNLTGGNADKSSAGDKSGNAITVGSEAQQLELLKKQNRLLDEMEGQLSSAANFFVQDAMYQQCLACVRKLQLISVQRRYLYIKVPILGRDLRNFKLAAVLANSGSNGGGSAMSRPSVLTPSQRGRSESSIGPAFAMDGGSSRASSYAPKGTHLSTMAAFGSEQNQVISATFELVRQLLVSGASSSYHHNPSADHHPALVDPADIFCCASGYDVANSLVDLGIILHTHVVVNGRRNVFAYYVEHTLSCSKALLDCIETITNEDIHESTGGGGQLQTSISMSVSSVGMAQGGGNGGSKNAAVMARRANLRWMQHVVSPDATRAETESGSPIDTVPTSILNRGTSFRMSTAF